MAPEPAHGPVGEADFSDIVLDRGRVAHAFDRVLHLRRSRALEEEEG